MSLSTQIEGVNFPPFTFRENGLAKGTGAPQPGRTMRFGIWSKPEDLRAVLSLTRLEILMKIVIAVIGREWTLIKQVYRVTGVVFFYACDAAANVCRAMGVPPGAAKSFLNHANTKQADA
jgi:hypothetical protein